MSSSFAYVSRMDTLQATILNYRLKNLDEKINKRRKIASIYFKKLKNLPILLPLEAKEEYNSYHLLLSKQIKGQSYKNFLRKIK